MQMALFLGSLYRSFSLFPSCHLVLPFSLFCCVAPAYIKQAVSLAALGDIALIFQHWGTGVMQCAAMDTLHENLSLLKWAKSGGLLVIQAFIYGDHFSSLSSIISNQNLPLFFLTLDTLLNIWCVCCGILCWYMLQMSCHQGRYSMLEWCVNIPLFPSREDTSLPFAAVISISSSGGSIHM